MTPIEGTNLVKVEPNEPVEMEIGKVYLFHVSDPRFVKDTEDDA